MAFATLSQLPYTASGIGPKLWFMQTDESFDTIITPGYLNNTGGAGINIEPGCFVNVLYAPQRLGIFTVTADADGVLTMHQYSPGDDSFAFERTIFVAKGGSDLNNGTSIGSPKLTIGAAITALAPNTSVRSLVVILDDGVYTEDLIFPFNITIWGPNSKVVAASADTFTINDSGVATLAVINVGSASSASGDVLHIEGPLSAVHFNGIIIEGDVYDEGSLVLTSSSVSDCVITLTADAKFSPAILNADTVSIVNPDDGLIVGSISHVDSNTVVYGDNDFLGHLVYQTNPSTETAGRTLEIADSNTRIVYNNAAEDDYTLPRTSDVAIPIGTNVEFTQLGLGAAVFVAGTGVTIVSAEGATVKTGGTGTTAKAWKYTDTIWIISGDIAAVGP